jgi:hypothetical protein
MTSKTAALGRRTFLLFPATLFRKIGSRGRKVIANPKV